MFLILGGIRVIFAVPLIHLKSGAPPTVDPRVLNFKASNFKTLLTICWGRAHVFLLIGVRLLIGTRDYLECIGVQHVRLRKLQEHHPPYTKMESGQW